MREGIKDFQLKKQEIKSMQSKVELGSLRPDGWKKRKSGEL